MVSLVHGQVIVGRRPKKKSRFIGVSGHHNALFAKSDVIRHRFRCVDNERAPSDFHFSTLLTTHHFPNIYASSSCCVGSFIYSYMRSFHKRGPMMRRACFWILVKTKCACTAIRPVQLWEPILFRGITFLQVTSFRLSCDISCSKPSLEVSCTSQTQPRTSRCYSPRQLNKKHAYKASVIKYNPWSPRHLILVWNVCLPLLKKTTCLLWVMFDHVHMKDHINQLQRVISCSRGADSPSFRSHVTSATHRQADFLRAL